MRIFSLSLLAALASAASLPAVASAELAKQHNCLSCHSVDKKVVGPSYKDIAAKYKGQSVEAALIDKIKHGSKGVYGQIPMPANANVPDADVKTLVKWILAQ
ncbi:c-type cytochrome [Rivihabitans pingtungensis]|uniref:c-type cytochrome n=1 Tax=Rivihabitans pingtungensis TaxID=1054498 RepID=UPI0023F372CE|nr:c-type cytochrome [Rivihabitans pingtungensis]